MTFRPPPAAPIVVPPALEKARLGQLDDITTELRCPDHDEALRLAFRARASLFDPTHFASPSLEELSTLRQEGGSASPYFEAAAVDSARSAVLDFEGSLLGQLGALWAPGDERLAPKTLALWHAVAASSSRFDDETARQLERAAGAAQDAELVLDVCAARALGAELEGEPDLSLENARRGSRMARTEARPLHEFFAHLILARARRLSRHPHLALRVLTSLAEYAPPPFHPWIAWELFFAGASQEEIQHRLSGVEAGQARSARAVHALFELVAAAQKGAQDDFEQFARTLQAEIASFAPARSDAEALIRALQPGGAGLIEERGLDDWQRGRSDVAPAPIHGLCLRAEREESDESSETYVLTAPGQEPCRILGMAAPLYEADHALRLHRTRRKQGRVETMAAVLALAGPDGLPLPDAFRPAYGFEYVPELHKGVIDVLMQRVRAYLGDSADLIRQGGHVALAPRVPLLVPDPRSAPRAYDRVLRILARVGRAKAADTAKASGLSVRAAQNALKELIDVGLCTVERQGKQVLYTVEDTTFSEPTQLIKRTLPAK